MNDTDPTVGMKTLAESSVVDRFIEQSTIGPILTSVLAGMAGAMAWGIRGQYGHETGAMIAGVLVGFILVVLHGRHLSSLMSARAVAMFALGISIGGSMTYGQTVGLTHDQVFVGNSEAYWWGMLGLAIKGGLWISIGAALFGMGLSGKRYSGWELLLLIAAMIAALLIGVKLLNRPFDPENELIPRFYFSHYSYWEAKQDRPRLERWGGLLFALSVLLIYLGAFKRDWLGLSLGLWGLVGGAIGFPGGQSLQAFNSWHGEWVRSLPTSAISNYFNWWNLMETSFGFIMGAVVGFGCWLHRRSINFFSTDQTVEPAINENITMPSYVEFILVAVHVWILVVWNFLSVDEVDLFADLALPMILIPAIAVMTGRFWPFLVSLPIVMVPIAGKTLRQLHFGEQLIPPLANVEWFKRIYGEESAAAASWVLYVVVPLVISFLVAMWFAFRSMRQRTTFFAPIGCILAAWLYFYLNDAFFHTPWPWKEWTGRTVHGAIYFLCVTCLTIAAIFEWSRWPRNSPESKKDMTS